MRATVEVLQGQLKRYENVDMIDGDGFTHPSPIQNDIEVLSKFTTNAQMVDATQRFKYNKNGEVIFNFGKYAGKNAKEILKNDKQYYNWILEKDFSAQVKQIVKKLASDTPI